MDKELEFEEIVTIKEYDSNNKLIHTKMSNGFEDWYEYNEKGEKIRYKNNNGVDNNYSKHNNSRGNILDKNGNIIRFGNFDGGSIKIKYDADNRPIHILYPSGQDEVLEYDQNGNLIYEKNMFGIEQTWGYDQNNNLIHYQNYATGSEWWQKFDSNNNVVEYKNSNGFIRTWAYKYDKKNRIIYSEDSDGFWIKNTYDSKGYKIKVEYSTKETYEFEYDSKGNEVFCRAFVLKGRKDDPTEQ